MNELQSLKELSSRCTFRTEKSVQKKDPQKENSKSIKRTDILILVSVSKYELANCS